MGGGLMQLVAYGAQDIYLTGNPQITFFKVVYRRHTNFSMEEIEQTLNGTTTNNAEQTCIVSRNGDLISNVWLEFKNTKDTGVFSSIATSEGDIYSILKFVECEIGGQLIDRQSNDWNAIWWNITTPADKVESLRDNFVGNSGADVSNMLYLPLNFWFCRNPGLALPLIALQYHEVKLKIGFGTVRSNTDINMSSLNPKLWINYIFLDTDERRRFAQVSHEYLIEQVQKQTFPVQNKSKFKLNFNHPVKELIWVCDLGVGGTVDDNTVSFAPLRAGNQAATAFSGSTKVEVDTYYFSDKCNIKLELNGHDRFAEREAKHFKTCQLFNHHTRVPSGKEFIINKNLDINASYADSSIGPVNSISGSGTLLFTPNRTVRLINGNITNSGIGGGDNYVKICKLNNPNIVYDSGAEMTTGGLSASATVMTASTLGAPNGSGIIIEGESGAGMTNIVHFKGNRSGDSIAITNQPIGISVVDDTGAFVEDLAPPDYCNVNIKFQELPTLIGGAPSTDLANIYCYSFALKPEEHQPSGTCNFSRIDSSYLEFSETFANGSTGTLKVFAVNYNVLRIMSGMGGLAYSN
jgi:hypothetical protein